MLRDGRGQIHRIAIYEATWMRSHGGAFASGDVSIPPSLSKFVIDLLVGKRYMLFLQNLGIL